MRLEAKRVGYRYAGGPWLFRGVDFTVAPGEVVGLVGPSGCGKTTLGKLLAGYLRPHEGDVALDGAALPAEGYHPVQLVFQHPEKAVNPRWRMRDIVNEGGAADPQLLDVFGIRHEWLDRWPNELSGGELQRFCIARALGRRTTFLIADEMTAMLDAITQAQIWHAVLSIANERNLGVLVISHEPHLIRRICSRVVDFQKLQ